VVVDRSEDVLKREKGREGVVHEVLPKRIE
jgi:hypothetical protein